MKKLKLYLEISLWNFYYADDAPEKKEETLEFFTFLDRNIFDIYVSHIVIDEFGGCKTVEEEQRLLSLLNKYSPIDIPVTQEAEDLAQKYLERKIVPQKKFEDALHVAVATVAEMDAVITWNYRHMANITRLERFCGVNLEEGYLKSIKIVMPTGVMDDES